jgi:hypothetical protein
MIARQQLARLLPLALLVVLAIVGLRGAVPAPRWDGPLRAQGVAIGIALEVVLGVLLVITLRRDRAARHAAATRPYSEADDEIGVPAALRFALRWLLGGGMVAVAAVLISNLHLHYFVKPHPLPARPVPIPPRRVTIRPAPQVRTYHFPLGPVLYGLLVFVIVAAVAISLWWAARQLRPALPRSLPDAADADELREAVESGRLAFAELDDARAAIIACYVAMERSLADQGAARGAADTPDELLARVNSAGIVRGAAARRLTGLFYEARFSTHPLGRAERDAASAALDELAAELGAGAEVAT